MIKKIFFFVLFIIYFLLIQTSFSKTNESNNCILDNNFKEINNIKNLNSISIDIPNTKKWTKDIFVILR